VTIRPLATNPQLAHDGIVCDSSREMSRLDKRAPTAMSATDQFLWSDPQRLGGRVCFRGTRVPVDALFENLEEGVSMDEFLDAFEGVTREQAVGVLEAARHALAGVVAV
jgi:uncharacterized protein (DUF433 family)